MTNPVLDASGPESRTTPVSSVEPPSSAGVRALDPLIVDAVHRAFGERAGPKSRLELEELQKSFEIRSIFLAERMLCSLDRDGDRRIDRAEFLEGVRRLVFGSTREKLRLAFDVHDLDGDGALQRDELERMIALGLEEEGMSADDADRAELAGCTATAERMRRCAADLADALMAAADRGGDRSLSFEDFERTVRQHPHVLKLIGRSEGQWLSTMAGPSPLRPAARSRADRLRRLLDNHMSVVLAVAAWAGLNAALFANAVESYRDHGVWVQLARGAGACLNLNSALVFVPVLRNLMDFARKAPLLGWLPVDDSMFFHRLFGIAVFAFGLFHVGAHLVNYGTYAPAGVVGSLLGTPAGQTGVFLLLATLTLWWFSRPSIRRSGRFELFAYSHLAYVPFAGFALLHGRSFWKWAALPLLGFAVHKVAQRVRVKRTTVQELEVLRSGVTRVELERPRGFSHCPGDYLLLRLPALSRFEWHPFTISSAPECERLTLHVRRLGNWTSALRALAKQRFATGQHDPLSAHIDGPYGTASGRIFRSRHVILVGAGIGVTPFASVLESLIRRQDRGGVLEKAYFFWLNRDPYSFEWFAGLLLHLEALDGAKKVDIHVYMTGGQRSITAAALNLARDVSHAAGKPDLVTGLRTRTHLGHPDFDSELKRIAQAHAPNPVELFFCGPPGLGRKLRGASADAGIRFFEEHF